MKALIGFATQFYTLWNYEAVKNYTADAYGNYHVSSVTHKYYYIKNISKDLEKVSAMYPGVEIDESLRGQSRDFSMIKKVDLPEGYFWFGKYHGKTIDEIIKSDFNYCLWASECGSFDIANQIKKHQVYIDHFKKIEEEEAEIIKNAQTVNAGDVVELEFLSNGYDADDNYSECWADAMFGETKLMVLCNGVKAVNGMYPYLMPMVNGKIQRTKGKKITVNVLEVFSTDIYGGVVKQQIRVA